MSSQQSPLEPHRAQILKLHSEGKSANQISNILWGLGIVTSERSVRRQLDNWKQEPEGNRKEVSSDLTNDPCELLKEAGLDPEEWEVERLKITNWDQGNEKLRSVKGSIVRKNPVGLIVPARAEGYKYKKPIPLSLPRESYKVVVVGDQQFPFHDKGLHETFLTFLNKHKPEEGILLGDTLDFSDISRHRINPERGASVQESIQTGYEGLRDYREASPETRWRKLAGNHDERLRNIVIDQLSVLYGVSRAQKGEESEPYVMSVEHLLRLDELGIEYIDPRGQYDQGQANITSQIAARHGWLANKGSGTTALKSLEQLGYSIIVGHSHRQSLVHKTIHDILGNTKTIVGVETGCMCNIGLGYAVAEDWQQGFAVVNVHDEDDFHIDLATYKNGVLYYRGERY